MSPATLSSEVAGGHDRHRLGTGPWIVGGLAVGAVGGSAWLVGLLLDAGAALHAYLTAFSFGVSIALCALCLLMIGHVTGAVWFVAVRRLAETLAATLPIWALLAIPILIGPESLYPWARPLASLSEGLREEVAHKAAYLDRRFFAVRSIAYLLLWSAISLALVRWSQRQDRREGSASAANPVVVSAISLPLFGFSITFAAFDWIMSLDPAWHSSIFGIYFFAGGFLGALAAMALLTTLMAERGPLAHEVSRGHLHALGRLMLTFVVFWAYIAFSQLLIVWIADVPSEVAWYLDRWEGGWKWVLILLGVGHFALPFLFLLSRPLQRRRTWLAGIAAWLLLMHWLDLYWLIAPARTLDGPWPGWEQAAALLLVSGCATAFGAWRMNGRFPVPVGDPRLGSSTEYRSP